MMRRLVAAVLLSFALAAPAYAADDGKPKGGPETGLGGLAPRGESEWTARSYLPFVVGGALMVLAGTCGLILVASQRRP
jgi:hypothetical protein